MANKITGTYRNGSSGDEVRQIQQKLIAEGYGDYLGKGQDDGIFGADTADAVKRYQQAKSLAVDGIVGEETLASLFGSNTGTETTKPTQAAPAQTATPATTPAATATPTEPAAPVTSPAGFTYGDFSYATWNPQDDPTIQQANALLQQHMSNPVGEYKPVWQDEADAYLSQYQNRDPFSYDFNSDALYNQYKDQYIQQGKLAMMDTMGQAAALTGGYGNSYAQTVGQQAYNQQLNQLNEIMPELYGMAYDRYNKEGQDLLDMYGMYMDREALAYSQHQDSLNNWYKQLDYLTDNYNTAYDRGYDNYLLGYENAWNEYSTDRAEEFEKYQNSINQQFTASENEKSRIERERASAKSDLVNLITSTGYNPTDSELAAAGMSREQANSYADAYAKAKTGEYEKLLPGTDAYGIVEKAINGAKDLDDLNRITQEYISIYGEDAIKRMGAFQKKIEELTPKESQT